MAFLRNSTNLVLEIWEIIKNKTLKVVVVFLASKGEFEFAFVLSANSDEKIFRHIYLEDRELVKWCKIFLKKVVGKFGGMGILVVPLQPQTGNGGSRQPRRQKKVLAVTEKVVTFAEPAAGVAEGGKKTFEMMLQTI